MAAEVQADLSERVYQATQLVSGPDPELAPHIDWVLGELLHRINQDDMTPEEKMGMAVILAGAHARKLSLGGMDSVADAVSLLRRQLAPPTRDVPPLRLITTQKPSAEFIN